MSTQARQGTHSTCVSLQCYSCKSGVYNIKNFLPSLLLCFEMQIEQAQSLWLIMQQIGRSLTDLSKSKTAPTYAKHSRLDNPPYYSSSNGGVYMHCKAYSSTHQIWGAASGLDWNDNHTSIGLLDQLSGGPVPRLTTSLAFVQLMLIAYWVR